MADAAVARAFSQAARHYDEHASVQLACARTLLDMVPVLAPDGYAMDLGCGTLPLARPIRERCPQQCWWAVDVSAAMLAEARDRGRLSGWQAMQADAEALPFAAGMFRLVFSSFALQWASSPRSVLEEIYRVLMPGGVLALAVPLTGTLQELQDSWSSVDGSAHVNVLPAMTDWLQAAEATGLTVNHQQSLGLCEYLPDVRAIARSLKETGANVVRGRRPGLVSPRRFREMESVYETLRTERGLPMTWQTGFLLMEKP